LKYIIRTPQFPSHVTEDDIAYFVYPDRMVLWAKGSEDVIHKEYINEDVNDIKDIRGLNTGRMYLTKKKTFLTLIYFFF
jgi:hypothetical protein